MRSAATTNLNRRSTTPSHWPSDIEYLRTLRYLSSIPSCVFSYIKGPEKVKNGTANFHTVSPTVVIRLIDSPSHPACTQRGLFASRKIPPHSLIIDYLGEVHCDERSDSDYDLSLYRSQEGDLNVGVDASRMGNEARFVNDYRGIKPKPNALFKDGRAANGELRMSVWSGSQGIGKGEEILVSYGKAWWNARSPEIGDVGMEDDLPEAA